MPHTGRMNHISDAKMYRQITKMMNTTKLNGPVREAPPGKNNGSRLQNDKSRPGINGQRSEDITPFQFVPELGKFARALRHAGLRLGTASYSLGGYKSNAHLRNKNQTIRMLTTTQIINQPKSIALLREIQDLIPNGG